MVMAFSLVTFTGCKSYQDDIDKLNTDLTALKTELTTLNTATKTALDTQIEALKARLAALEAKPAGVSQADFDALKLRVAALEAYKTTVDTQLAAIKATADAAATKADLTALATRLDKKTVEIENTITALGDKLTKLDGTVTNLGTRVDEAIARLTQADKDNAALLADINARLATLEGLNGVAGLKTQVAANTADITKLKSDLAALAVKVEKNTTDITALQAQLAIITANMRTLANAIHVNFDILNNRLTSLTYVPDFFVNGIEAMNFSPLMSSCKAITPQIVVAYHLNPSFITKADIETDNMSFALIESQNLITTPMMGAPKAAVQVKANFVKIEGGKIYVSVSVSDFDALFANTSTNYMENYSGVMETFPMVALQIPLSAKAVQENALDFGTDGTITVVNDTEYPSNRVITAQYVRMYYQSIYAQEDVYLAKVFPTNPVTYTMLSQTLSDAKALAVKDVDGATATNPLVFTLPYGQGNTIDLADQIKALLHGTPFDVDKYGLKFHFDLDTINSVAPHALNPIVYNRGSNNTDQQQFIKINDATKGTIQAKVFTQAEIAAAQGRTPIVRVTMYNAQDPNCPVLESFVKIYLADKPLPTPITVNFTIPSSVGPCDSAKTVLTVQQMNEQIYNATGLSKEEFHAAYPSSLFTYTGDGIVREVYSPDGQITDSYLLNWTLAPDVIWNKLMTTDPATFSATAVYTPTLPTLYPKVTITFTRSFTKPAGLNITSAQLISNYWYTNTTASPYPYVKHNIGVPYVGQTDPSTAIFSNNINQAFEQNANKSLKALANYEYYFLPTQPKHIDGTTNGTTLTVSSDGKQLLLGTELIATINPFAANVGDVLTLNQASATAKRLLNYASEFLTARIGIRSVYCANLPNNKMAVTINGNPFFDVKFIRPINAIPNPAEYFVDGKNFGETHTYLAIDSLVNLADWRNSAAYVSTFAKYPNYYQYYGITAITADVANIKTDLNQTGTTKVPVTNYPDLEVAYAASVAGVTPVAPYGYLTYKNNGNTLGVKFNLYVPVTIQYSWGSIVSTTIQVPVEKTVGPSGVKARK